MVTPPRKIKCFLSIAPCNVKGVVHVLNVKILKVFALKPSVISSQKAVCGTCQAKLSTLVKVTCHTMSRPKILDVTGRYHTISILL